MDLKKNGTKLCKYLKGSFVKTEYRRKNRSAITQVDCQIFTVFGAHADSHVPHKRIPEFLRGLGKTCEGWQVHQAKDAFACSSTHLFL